MMLIFLFINSFLLFHTEAYDKFGSVRSFQLYFTVWLIHQNVYKLQTKGFRALKIDFFGNTSSIIETMSVYPIFPDRNNTSGDSVMHHLKIPLCLPGSESFLRLFLCSVMS